MDKKTKQQQQPQQQNIKGKEKGEVLIEHHMHMKILSNFALNC